MHVFIIGGTDWIGLVVIDELLKTGHTVTGFACTDGEARTLRAKGVNVLRGSFDDTTSLMRGATKCDGVIHMETESNADTRVKYHAINMATLQVLGDVLLGSKKPFIVTSSTVALAEGKVTREDDAGNVISARECILALEDLILGLAREGVHACSIRLPIAIHGPGDDGFINDIAVSAKKYGKAFYVNDGQSRWPAVNCADAAVLYRLALEKGAVGTYNAVAEEEISVKDIVQTIGAQMNLPIESLPMLRALDLDNSLPHVMMIDNPSSSMLTRQELGWKISGLGLLADIKAGVYPQE
jgi:nucleoside-diphosphate-sugar epimerase